VVLKERSTSINLLEFSSSQVGKFVDSILDTITFSVELSDLVEVFDKDTESGNFFSSSVGLLILDLPGRPQRGKGVSSQSSAGKTSKSKKGNEEDNFIHIDLSNQIVYYIS